MKKLLPILFVLALTLSAANAVAYTFGSDVPDAVKQQMTADMAFIAGIQGGTASPLHQKIFGESVDGPTYVNFFSSRVTEVGMRNCGNENAVACVIPTLGSSKIWLTSNYTQFDHPQIAKMMVVFHESRHTEKQNKNWPHAYCPNPFLDANGQAMKSIWTGAPLAGEPGCDTTPFGSYGSSLIMLKNIQKFCTNCTDKVKMDAGLYADDQFKRIISKSAVDQINQDLYSDDSNTNAAPHRRK